MEKKSLIEKAKSHLQVLCSEIGERRVGSERNRQATAYAKRILEETGWQTVATELPVIDWKTDGATLICDGLSFDVFSSHYSLGCCVKGELIAIDTVAQLEQADIRGKVVLLHGEIASEQMAPKKFPFWNPEEHRYIISLLERSGPKALVCATERNSATAGGVYPFPLFEDGDFDIPSVYMKDTEGQRLLACTGRTVRLQSGAIRIPETAFNVIARNCDRTRRRIVITAHIDTKIGTPGAIDNATGVATVLLLAELLKDVPSKYPIELVIFNGEDYYGAPGQVKYMVQNAGKFGDIQLNINIDGAGYKDGPSCFSPFNLPEKVHEALCDLLCNQELIEGLPWYQGDHTMFLQKGCPAIAVSSGWFVENMECQEITHTPEDNLSIVSYERVAECSLGIFGLINKL